MSHFANQEHPMLFGVMLLAMVGVLAGIPKVQEANVAAPTTAFAVPMTRLADSPSANPFVEKCKEITDAHKNVILDGKGAPIIICSWEREFPNWYSDEQIKDSAAYKQQQAAQGQQPTQSLQAAQSQQPTPYEKDIAAKAAH